MTINNLTINNSYIYYVQMIKFYGIITTGCNDDSGADNECSGD